MKEQKLTFDEWSRQFTSRYPFVVEIIAEISTLRADNKRLRKRNAALESGEAFWSHTIKSE